MQSPEPVETLSAQVLVIGAGVAGVCAAIQAARLGADVLLLEMDDVLGGNSGPNLGIHISGAHSFHPYGGETGIIEELEEDAAAHGAKLHTHTMHYNTSRLWEAELYTALRAAGVRVLRRAYAREPLMDGDRIAAVLVDDLAALRALRVVVSGCVIEASGDGRIAVRAGATYLRGREGRDAYGERSAPEVGDNITLGSSVTALVRKAHRPIPFTPPPDTPPFEPGYGYAGPDASGSCLRAHSAWDPDADLCYLWHTESGGQLDTLADERAIYDELLRQLYSVWNHIKNEAHAEESRNWELIWVSPKAGRRESRRFVGDHVLTQTEIEAGQAFPDAVAYGGYAIDIHNPAGARRTQVDIVFCSIPPLYGIPYRCLYAREVANLLFASRLISTTHLAHGTTRLQRTLATVGQAAGAAAALCLRHGCGPRTIYTHHREELQQMLLRHDATLLGVANRDPADLARGATVTASSEERHGSERLHDLLPLDRERGMALWHWPERLDAVALYLRNESAAPLALTLNLAAYRAAHPWKGHDAAQPPISLVSGNRADWGNMDRADAFAPLAAATATLPADYEGWLTFRFAEPVVPMPHDCTSDESSLLLALGPAGGVYWARDRHAYDHCRRVEREVGAVRYAIHRDAHLFRLTPAPSYGEAANVVNGWHRRFSSNPVNMWISDLHEPLPQWLELAWDAAIWFDCVQLTFDTLALSYRDMPINRDALGVAGRCVRDYDLEVWRDGAWVTILQERGNYHRQQVHRVPRQRAGRLRLVVRATHEPGWPARVYEVRVYDDGKVCHSEGCPQPEESRPVGRGASGVPSA
ncbi:MAG: FAD-dependent oxidoreductase [Chloroflexota bacterium]